MKKRNFLKAAISIMLVLMLGIGTTMTSVTSESVTEKTSIQIEQIPGDWSSRFYQCMIICGIPWVIIIAALAFAGEGMGTASALLMAGATAAMIACVIACLGSNNGSQEMSECQCQQTTEA